MPTEYNDFRVVHTFLTPQPVSMERAMTVQTVLYIQRIDATTSQRLMASKGIAIVIKKAMLTVSW